MSITIFQQVGIHITERQKKVGHTVEVLNKHEFKLKRFFEGDAQPLFSHFMYEPTLSQKFSSEVGMPVAAVVSNEWGESYYHFFCQEEDTLLDFNFKIDDSVLLRYREIKNHNYRYYNQICRPQESLDRLQKLENCIKKMLVELPSFRLLHITGELEMDSGYIFLPAEKERA